MYDEDNNSSRLFVWCDTIVENPVANRSDDHEKDRAMQMKLN